MSIKPVWVWRCVAAIALILVIVPQIDLAASRLLFRPVGGFVLSGNAIAVFMRNGIQALSWGLGLVLTFGAAFAFVRRRIWLRIDGRQWLFLLIALILGPGLTANVILKTQWDRARPAHVEAFGGSKRFSPALVISDQCDHNCSFVSGDASTGFFLHSFAYVVLRRRRRLFFGGLAIGALVGGVRMAQGAHFLSDVFYAGLVVVGVTAASYALVFGRDALAAWWRQVVFSAEASSA
ncbi:lipid A 4'-phosphatase [Azospirillaceae bacterium]